MEGIADLVSESLARHGFTTQVDHRRLQWSMWSRCESSLSVLLVPGKPGLFELAEEQAADKPGFVSGFVPWPRFSDAVTAAGSVAPLGADPVPLVLFRISETEDLGMALARLFLPNTPEQDRLSRKPCYVRYAVIEDEDQRRATYRSLQEWIASPSQSNSAIPDNLAVHNFTVDEKVEEGAANQPPRHNLAQHVSAGWARKRITRPKGADITNQ
jgi:hypothetical protein